MDRTKFLGKDAAPAAVAVAPAPEATPPRPHRAGRRVKAEGPEHKVLSMPGKGTSFPAETMAFTVGDAVDRCREEVRQAIARMARMVGCFGAAGVLPEEFSGVALQALDMLREQADRLPAFEETAEAIRST